MPPPLARGIGWAAQSASWAELEWLARSEIDWDRDGGTNPNEGAYVLAQAIRLGLKDAREVEELFGPWVEGTPYPTWRRLDGFADGAVEFYDEVRDQVEG